VEAERRFAPTTVRISRNTVRNGLEQVSELIGIRKKPEPVRLRGSSEGSSWSRFQRSKRRQRASMSTWPPWAVAWSELVNWRCSLVFRLVKAGMALCHHIGAIVSSPFSPKIAFFFTMLMIWEQVIFG